MKKKIVSISLALTLGLAAVVFAQNPAEDDIMLIEETPVISQSPALVVDGTVIEEPEVLYNEGNFMIPLRKVCETLGMEVNWDAETNMITITKGAVYVTCYPNADGYTFARTAPQYLGEAPILIEGTTYVPVSFIDKILQGTSAIENNTIVVTYAQEESPSLTANAVITAMSENQITVNDETRGEVLVNITEETEITDLEGTALTFADLKENTNIEVTYSEMMTRSLPPMTNAVKIVVLGQTASLTANVKVTAVEEGKITVDDETRGEVVVNITEETEITDAEGNAKTAADIKAGAELELTYGDAMTMSLPPIANAVKIVIK